MNTTTPGMAAYQPCITHRSTGAFRAISAHDGILRAGRKRARKYRPTERPQPEQIRQYVSISSVFTSPDFKPSRRDHCDGSDPPPWGGLDRTP